jgi:hypothetical protein
LVNGPARRDTAQVTDNGGNRCSQSIGKCVESSAVKSSSVSRAEQ